MKNQVRIISGKLRGRKLPVVDGIEGLRPTGDRIRETLFNWLQFHVPGQRCVDLFTGTGALAMEAASRGAKEIIAIDTQRQLIANLQQLKNEWPDIEALQPLQADAIEWLQQQPSMPWSVYFIDPPFASNLQQTVLDLIASKPAQGDQRIYIESPADMPLMLPENCAMLKDERAGNVAYRLVLRDAHS